MSRRLSLVVVAALSCTSCSVLGLQPPCSGTELVAEFEQVSDLVENSNVQSADVVIGTVTDISLDQREYQAEVTMCIDAEQRIPADSEASIRSTSLLGEKFVALTSASSDGPYLEDASVIDVSRTTRSTDLEEVFTSLAQVLGAGNLEKINEITASQAEILEGRAGELRALLRGLRRFTGTLAERKGAIVDAVDSLDEVAGTILDDRAVLEKFLASFARSSTVLSEQSTALQDLLSSLDRFSAISLRLLDQTERGLDEQFRDLRPVLRTAAENSETLAEGLRTLATFTVYWPETMPGDYLQLDVCQAGEHDYDQGLNCPQSTTNDNPGESAEASPRARTGLEFLLEQPLRGDR